MTCFLIGSLAIIVLCVVGSIRYGRITRDAHRDIAAMDDEAKFLNGSMNK